MTEKQHSVIFDDIAEPVVCIMGPTASGKTDLAFALADHVRSLGKDVDIISVDSVLVYRDMNIGTAKPTTDELEQYPHALVDIIDPTDSYSAADFVTDARQLVMESHAAGRLPILVGGTMLYFQAFFGGLNDMPAADPEVRALLTQQAVELGIQVLHARLHEVDPITAARLQPMDSQRIIRALEVYQTSGKPLSSYHQTAELTLPASWQVLAMMPDRAWLHERIAQRLDIMWQSGFVDEVRYLMDKYPLHADLPAIRAVGYRQVWQYLKHTRLSDDDRQVMQDKALFATRQLAKRQYTWLRKLHRKYDIKIVETNSQAREHLLKSHP